MHDPGLYNPYAPPAGAPPYARPQIVITDLELAGLGERFLAHLIDSCLVSIPAVLCAVAGGFFAAAAGENGVPDERIANLGILGMLAILVLGAAAQIVAQATWGQSFGKHWLGIRVARIDGRPLTVMHVILARNVALMVIASFCGLVNIIDALMIFGSDRRCLHDLIAGTKVVRAR